MGKIYTEREEFIEVYETDDNRIAIRINCRRDPTILTESEWFELMHMLNHRGDV